MSECGNGRALAHDQTGDEFTHALMKRKRIVNTQWRFMERFNFLLTPTAASVAFPIGLGEPTHIDGQAVNTVAWRPFSSLANLIGLPAASLPVEFTAEGFPIGLQIMGQRLDDRRGLALASAVKGLHPMRDWRPAVFAGHQES